MSALNWRPGTIYAPGSVVRPNAVPPPPAPATLENPDFEAGASGWTVTEGALAIVSDPGNAFNGTYIARLTGPTANSAIQNNAVFPVMPGQQVTARCMIRVNAADQVGGTVAIVWLDSSNSVISSSEGNQVNVLGGGVYRQSAVTAIAPAGAVACKIAGFAFALQSGTVRFDAFSIVYQPPVNVGSSLVYRAVQPNVGTSDATEPAWPTTVGQQVNDGTVVWEAIEANIVLWEAEPILITGGTEPDWPTVPGAVVEDNGIIWRCIGRNVRDERCPNSKVVAIGAAKVFAADDDIIRYSATGNPLDWSTQDDAGFLPSGLQQNGANRIDVLNLYRSNLVALNASTFQMWQIDPDPEQMALLDAMEGIGSVWQKAAQPVSNDLFLLSALGVRTVGIAVGSTNLQAGDVGMPIDTLVQEAVTALEGADPISCYYPAAGQYWLVVGGAAPPTPEGAWVPIQTAFPDVRLTRNFDSTASMPGTVTFENSIISAAGVRAQVGVGSNSGVLYVSMPLGRALRATYLSYAVDIGDADPGDYVAAKAQGFLVGNGGIALERESTNLAALAGSAVTGWEAAGGQPFVIVSVEEAAAIPPELDVSETRFTHQGAYIDNGIDPVFDSLFESFEVFIEVWLTGEELEALP